MCFHKLLVGYVREDVTIQDEERFVPEELFSVKVVKVNVRNRKGKAKRMGRSMGYGQGRKEAIVTLRQGDKLDIY